MELVPSRHQEEIAIRDLLTTEAASSEGKGSRITMLEKEVAEIKKDIIEGDRFEGRI